MSDCLSGLLLREPSANDLWQRPKLSVFTAVGCLISDLSAWKLSREQALDEEEEEEEEARL